MLITLANFAGVAPKLAPFMLQPNQAQVALNTRLWTGALEPLPAKLAVKTGVSTLTESIYRFGQDTAGDTNYWFTWDKHVHAVKGPIAGDTTERTYFSGDGYPKVTNNSVALASQPYPSGAYRLGVPAPTMAPYVSAITSITATASATDTLEVTTPVSSDKVFAKANFDVSGNGTGAFDSIVIFSLPTAGVLKYNGSQAVTGQIVTLADLTAGKLVFSPVAGAKATPYTSFTFRQKIGTYESQVYSLIINVNNLPVSANSSFTVYEDTPGAFSPANFSYSDANNDTPAYVRIKTTPAAGTLQLYGGPVYADQTIPWADIVAGRLTFVSVLNGNGTPYTSFKFAVSDGSAESAVDYTMTVNVTAVNDAPTASNSIVRTKKNAAKVLAKDDFGFADVDTSDTLQSVIVASLPSIGALKLNNVSVAIGQTISIADINAGLFKYVPATDGSGVPYTSFTYKVNDGQASSDSTYTLTVHVYDSNTAAKSTGASRTILPNTATALAIDDFKYTDNEGDAIASVKIFSLPTAGSLKLNGTSVTVDQIISAANIKSGLLVFTPDADVTGKPYASFGFRLSDGTVFSQANTFTINVNTPPVASNTTVSVAENAVQALSASMFGFSDADADKFNTLTVKTIPSAGTLALDGVTVTVGQVVRATDIYGGKLTFTPAKNTYGTPYTSFTFTVSDGFTESVATYTLTLNVTESTASGVTSSTSEALETRAYVYTYVSGFGEEGQPSDPSLIAIYPSSQNVVLKFAAVPTGNYNLSTIRVYRTAVGASGTNYYLVDEIAISLSSYTDAVAGTDLAEPIPSLTWAMPPDDLDGLIALPNGFLAGFSGRDIYFSEAYHLHAWPTEYMQSVDYPIVALGQYGQSVVVLTTGSPYMLTGTDPTSMTLQKLEFEQACLSAKSVCRLGAGVVYASPDGLAYIGPDGMQILTDNFFTRKEWQTINPSSIIGEQHDGRYYAFYDDGVNKGGFILDPKSNGSPFVFTNQYYSGLYNDLRNDALYGVYQGTISKLEGSSTGLTYTWRSKQFLLQRPQNFRVAQVIAADYTSITAKYYVDGVLKYTKAITSQDPFKLPSGFRGRTLEIEFTGTSTVIAAYIADSVSELQNV